MTTVRSLGILPTVVAAAVALSSGCIIEANPPQGSVAIYWTFWSQSLGEIGAFDDPATAICTVAAVDDVRITLTTPAGDTLNPSNGPCITNEDVPGAAFAGMEPGTWGYYLEGRRGGLTVYEDSGTFEVNDGERTLVDSRSIPPDGSWDVAITYTSGACAAGDRMKFSLVDTSGSSRVTVFSTDDARVNPPVVVPCTHVGPFTIPSVRGGRNYEFTDWIQTDAGGTVPVAWSTCREAWAQSSSATTALTVAVTAPGPSTPGSLGVCP